jgi:predicted ATPase
MTDSSELREVERRIQVVEDNLRQLQEQVTALSGAADEARIANRVALTRRRNSQLCSSSARL